MGKNEWAKSLNAYLCNQEILNNNKNGNNFQKNRG